VAVDLEATGMVDKGTLFWTGAIVIIIVIASNWSLNAFVAKRLRQIEAKLDAILAKK
jgi:hypothetical protein